MLAQAYLALGRWRDALSQAEAAVAVDPEDDLPHQLQASALLGLRRRKAAKAAAHVAVRLAPGSATAHAVLGEALLACGRSVAAADRARHVVGLDPQWSGGHELLGRSAMGRGRLGRAEEHFRDALRLDPENPVILNNLGHVLNEQGRRREAVNLYGAASVADPKDSTARHNATIAAARHPAVGIVALVVIVGLSVPGRIWALAWPPSLDEAVVGVALAGLAVAVLRRRSGRDVHEYPMAAPELISHLRKLATRRGPPAGWTIGTGDEPIATAVVIAAVGFSLTATCVYGLLHPPAIDPSPAYGWFLIMAWGSALGGGGVVAILRRRSGWLGRLSARGDTGAGDR